MDPFLTPPEVFVKDYFNSYQPPRANPPSPDSSCPARGVLAGAARTNPPSPSSFAKEIAGICQDVFQGS